MAVLLAALVLISLFRAGLGSRLASLTSAPAAAGGNAVTLVPGTSAERWQEDEVLLVGTHAWDGATRSAVETALSLLPQAVRSQLGNPELGPLLINVSTDGRTLSGHQPYAGPANFYSTNEGRNEIVLYPAQTVETVLHELGHAYNLRSTPAGSYAQVLLEPEMQSFMAATGWQVATAPDQLRRARNQTQVAFSLASESVWQGLSRNDPLEDFANSFAVYYSDPESLRRLSPERYNWFERNLGR